MTKISNLLKNPVVERSLWTLAQAALGLVSVEALHIPVAYAPVVASGLAVLKNVVKEHLSAVSGSEA